MSNFTEVEKYLDEYLLIGSIVNARKEKCPKYLLNQFCTILVNLILYTMIKQRATTVYWNDGEHTSTFLLITTQLWAAPVHNSLPCAQPPIFSLFSMLGEIFLCSAWETVSCLKLDIQARDFKRVTSQHQQADWLSEVTCQNKSIPAPDRVTGGLLVFRHINYSTISILRPVILVGISCYTRYSYWQ
jgi:hypothetical protein